MSRKPTWNLKVAVRQESSSSRLAPKRSPSLSGKISELPIPGGNTHAVVHRCNRRGLCARTNQGEDCEANHADPHRSDEGSQQLRSSGLPLVSQGFGILRGQRGWHRSVELRPAKWPH